MPPKKKRCIAPVNQEKLLEDDTFLGYDFYYDSDNEANDCELMSSDDRRNDDNTEEIGDLENDSDVHKIHTPEVPRKQKFVNIEEITALDNFNRLPPQEQTVFHYSGAKRTFVMNWHTDKKKFSWKSPCLQCYYCLTWSER